MSWRTDPLGLTGTYIPPEVRIDRLEVEIARLAGELGRAECAVQLGLAREAKLREGLAHVYLTAMAAGHACSLRSAILAYEPGRQAMLGQPRGVPCACCGVSGGHELDCDLTPAASLGGQLAEPGAAYDEPHGFDQEGVFADDAPPAAPEPEGADDPWMSVTQEQARALLLRAEQDLSDLGAEDGLLAVGLSLGRRADEIAALRDQARQNDALAAQQRTRIEGLELQAASAERWKALAGRQADGLARLSRIHADAAGEGETPFARPAWLKGLLSDSDGFAALAELQDLRKRVADLETTVAARDGTLYMAVARLGGMVEGAPTHRGNFLQRIDFLVADEAKWKGVCADLRERAERAERKFGESEQERFRLAAALAETDTRAERAERDNALLRDRDRLWQEAVAEAKELHALAVAEVREQAGALRAIRLSVGDALALVDEPPAWAEGDRQ